jgi:5,8-dihydroxy-2-naphthoate synthase
MAATLAETFTLGHSPDPDDAFMFYAMAEKKIDLRGYRFQHQLEDIQTLNVRAKRGELHISAVSIHAYAYVSDKYLLLPCGASMGDGYGPLVIEKHRTSNERRTSNEESDEVQTRNRSGLSDGERSTSNVQRPTSNDEIRARLRNCVIAVPGTMTSAFLALKLYLGEFNYVVVPFDQIFDAVRNGRADAGLIIHEGQLTYAHAGFAKIVDLGEWWKNSTGLPLPLGGNVLRRDIPSDVRRDLCAILRESIEFGLAHRREAVEHSMPYARDMNSDQASKFIGMYVNEFTRDYGEIGREAIRRFLGEACRRGYVDREVSIEFVE